VYCKNCGHENDEDATFCENCGANLGSTSPQETSAGMSRINKILIVAVIVLVLGVGLTVGLLLTSKSPASNTTVNNTSVNVTESENTLNTPTDTIEPKLIDSGSMSGSNAKYQDGPFTYEWKTYQVDDNDLLMYGTYVAGSKTVKQTITLKKWDEDYVEITAEPKSSGKSSWYTVTTLQDYSTVVDYYWGVFRPAREQIGPVS